MTLESGPSEIAVPAATIDELLDAHGWEHRHHLDRPGAGLPTLGAQP
jgi:hypothetical protein